MNENPLESAIFSPSEIYTFENAPKDSRYLVFKDSEHMNNLTANISFNVYKDKDCTYDASFFLFIIMLHLVILCLKLKWI